MWGILPMLVLALFIITYTFSKLKRNDVFQRIRQKESNLIISNQNSQYPKLMLIWMISISWFFLGFFYYQYNQNVSLSKPQNTIKAYYNALDFKQFADAYELLDPKDKPSMEQFMLELSLEDGILSSYAKLDHIKIQEIETNKEVLQKFKINSTWISSLDEYRHAQEMELIQRNGKFYIKHKTYEKRIPVDQFYVLPELTFKNQGRRKAKTGKTFRSDELDRPEIKILNANLVLNEDEYFIIGELINLDNDPAYISIKASLYDRNDEVIINANVNDILKRNLLPKEITPFKIDLQPYFQELAIKNKTISREEDHIDASLYIKKLTSINLFASSLVSQSPIYRYAGVQNFRVEKEKFQIELMNYGPQEISVPQILMSYYHDKNLIWVEGVYYEKGIRANRKKYFKQDIPNIEDQIQHIRNIELKNCFTNGTRQTTYVKTKPVENYKLNKQLELNITLNPFISLSGR